MLSCNNLMPMNMEYAATILQAYYAAKQVVLHLGNRDNWQRRACPGPVILRTSVMLPLYRFWISRWLYHVTKIHHCPEVIYRHSSTPRWDGNAVVFLFIFANQIQIVWDFSADLLQIGYWCRICKQKKKVIDSDLWKLSNPYTV